MSAVRRAAIAGLAYFAIVFAAGFVLGAIRTLWVAPALGAVGAVLIELPIMLAVAWFACGWAVRRLFVPPALGERLTMGVVAFALLMVAEFALALALRRTAAEFFAGYGSAAGLVGLAGQMVFGAMPAIQGAVRT